MYGRRLAYANYKNHAALLLNAVSSLPTLRFRGFWTCWGSMACIRGTRMLHLSHGYLSLQRRVLRVSPTPGALLRMGHARGTGRSQAAHASSTALNWLAISRTRKTARITSTLRGAALHPRTFSTAAGIAKQYQGTHVQQNRTVRLRIRCNPDCSDGLGRNPLLRLVASRAAAASQKERRCKA